MSTAIISGQPGSRALPPAAPQQPPFASMPTAAWISRSSCVALSRSAWPSWTASRCTDRSDTKFVLHRIRSARYAGRVSRSISESWRSAGSVCIATGRCILIARILPCIARIMQAAAIATKCAAAGMPAPTRRFLETKLKAQKNTDRWIRASHTNARDRCAGWARRAGRLCMCICRPKRNSWTPGSGTSFSVSRW